MAPHASPPILLTAPEAPLPHPCAGCRYGAASVWQPVVEGSRRVLVRGFQRRPLDEGETLFAQGTSNDGVHCLSQGLIALRSYRPDGGSALVRLVYPGDILGFRSFLSDDVHQTDATALVPSRVCLVARREARQVVAGSPQTLERIARRCADELARARSWQRAAVRTGNRTRLAQLIVQLAEGQAPQGEGPFRMRLPLSRQDMAAALGVEPETVSRLIRRLRDDAGLRVKGRWVEMDSFERLRKLA